MNSNIFWDITPSTDVSEESLLAPVFTLVSCSTYLSTLKMEAICSSETSFDFQRTTRRYISEDSILHNHRCENLKSYTKAGMFTRRIS
jgi:hypothetical protein